MLQPPKLCTSRTAAVEWAHVAFIILVLHYIVLVRNSLYSVFLKSFIKLQLQQILIFRGTLGWQNCILQNYWEALILILPVTITSF
jgi:hypothetical protein